MYLSLSRLQSIPSPSEHNSRTAAHPLAMQIFVKTMINGFGSRTYLFHTRSLTTYEQPDFGQSEGKFFYPSTVRPHLPFDFNSTDSCIERADTKYPW